MILQISFTKTLGQMNAFTNRFFYWKGDVTGSNALYPLSYFKPRVR